MRSALPATVLAFLLLTASALAAQEAAPPPLPPAETAWTADGGIPAHRIAVLRLRFEGPYASQLRDWVPALIETRLAEDGWTVLARGESMTALQQERNLPGLDPTTTPAPDRLYAATALLELTARAEVEDLDAGISVGFLSIGGLVTARFHLSGRLVDTETGVITPLGQIRESRSRLRRLAVVFPEARWIGGGFNLSRITDTLVGSAADAAALKLVDNLNRSRHLVPGQEAAVPVDQDTVTLAFPEGMRPAPGAEYGIYRGDRLIARVRVTSFQDGRAVCRILAATDQIRPTDVARPLEVVVPVEVQTY